MLVGVAAVVLTALTALVFKGHKSWLMTFVQNFCGALFVFSGWVKAIDPLGTAYKMGDYFDEFYNTFSETWLSFLAPIFPFFAEHAIWFSVSVIIFEIVLGLMLIIGSKPKFTSWAFFLLVGFFTVLTGFTYLTGFVPDGSNFFDFGSWVGVHNENNMKVKDCGCFGDFIKLKPKTSFLKDVFLLFPAIYFLFRHNDMHQWFGEKTRRVILGSTTGLLLIYCLNNFVFNLPHADFRPFKKSTDVRAQKQLEEEAMASVQITHWILKNKQDGKIVELPNQQYLTQYKDYPKTEWEIVDQKKTKPAIEPSKISEMEFSDIEEGYDVTSDIFDSEEASLMIVSYKLKGEAIPQSRMVKDTIFNIDTVSIFDGKEEVQEIVKSVKEIKDKSINDYKYTWDTGFLEDYKNKILPLARAATESGVPVRIMIGGADKQQILALKEAVGLENVQFCKADDILLKTIVRSNPGVLLIKDGKILDKWHKKRLIDFKSMQDKLL